MTQQQTDKQNVFTTGASGSSGTTMVRRLDKLGYRAFAGIQRGEDGQTPSPLGERRGVCNPRYNGQGVDNSDHRGRDAAGSMAMVSRD